MVQGNKQTSRDLLGKTIVTKSGRTLGKNGDLIFEVRTGEILNLILVNPTGYSQSIDFEVNKEGKQLIPFSAVIAIDDFIIVNEDDLV